MLQNGVVSLCPNLCDVIYGRPLINPKITHLQCEQGKPLLEWLVMCRFKCDPLPNLVITSISAFLILDVQSPKWYSCLSFRHTKCATNMLFALSSPLTAFFTDKFWFRTVLSLLMLMQMLTNRLFLQFRFWQLASSEYLLFQKSKIKPVSGAPWFWKKSHRRRREPPRCTSRARVACEASSLPCCCCRLSSLRC